MRQFLEIFLPLILPTVVYLLYVRVANRQAPSAPGQPS